MTARRLSLFLVDGRPDGILTVEDANWPGHVLKTQRTQFGEARKRPEAARTGVYLLIGEKEGKPLAYIGQADNVGVRISQHDTLDKDWWDKAIIVTSANKLNPAHVRYLEARLISLARRINKITLDNGNSPAILPLTEAERAEMEAFLAHIRIVLPLLGIGYFEDNTRPDMTPQGDRQPGKRGYRAVRSDSPLFELKVNKDGMFATARQVDGKFVVEKDSIAAVKWNQKGHYPSYGHLFEELVRAGILKKEGEHRAFSKNYAFESASAAASVVKGRPYTGPRYWRIRGQPQKTLKDWEKEIASDGS